MADAITSSSPADDDMHKPENCNKLDVLVEEARHKLSRRGFASGPDRTSKRHIYMAATSGDWIEASSYGEIHPNWVRIPLTTGGNTALHVAVSMEQTSFVSQSIEYMSMEDMEIQRVDGNTAFCLAAISGNVKIATILLGKNPRLVWIRGQKEMLPIQLASSAGHSQMAEFLFQRTEEELCNLPSQDIVSLFFLTITNCIYTVASKLLDLYPELANTENEEGLTALQVLVQFSFHKEVPGYRDVLTSLSKGVEEEEPLNCVKSSKAMFDAAKSGNIMVLEFLFKCNPDLLTEVNSSGQSLLHIAILYRQETVYRLILSKGTYKHVMMQLVDFDGNNVLHLAGRLPPKGRFESSTRQVLMGSEQLWFQEVEKKVPPALKTMRNKDGWTPKELFIWEHKELLEEAVSTLKGMANNYLVVATLIITLGITGALTIPVKDIDSPQPHTLIFPKKTWYTFFLLSIAIGTCLCATSMIFYGSVILPSSWEPKDEDVSVRQRKLILGNMTLFASVGIMLAASTSGSILIFDFLPNWVFYVIAALSLIPMVVSPVINYSLWVHYVHSVLAFCQKAPVTLTELLLLLLWPIRKIYEANQHKFSLN